MVSVQTGSQWAVRSSAVTGPLNLVKGSYVCDLPAKYGLIFHKNKLNNLVLVDHVHGHICCLCLRAQKCRAEHDGYTLRGHPVLVDVLDHSTNREKSYKQGQLT